MPKFVEFHQTDPDHIVHIDCNGVEIGYIYLEIGAGEYVFWLNRGQFGYLPEHVMREIVNKLKEMNDKLNGEEPKSEIIHPAIRKIDLDD